MCIDFGDFCLASGDHSKERLAGRTKATAGLTGDQNSEQWAAGVGIRKGDLII